MTTLSDNEISSAIDSGALLLNADKGMLDGASYELRLGQVYYDLTEGGKRFSINENQPALIKPGHQVVLITAEDFRIPPDILVRIVNKGSLFSVGLSAVATYADPGFKGNIGIVTENISDKYIILPQWEPIAKADFTRLTSPATKLYQGQHGFQAGIWPIKTHLQKTYKEISNDSRVGAEKDEAFALLPAATQSVIRRMETTQLWTIIALAIALFVNSSTLFLVGGNYMDGFLGIVGNLVASAFVGIATVAATFLRKAR